MPELIVWMHAGSPWHRTAPVTWCEIYTRKLGTRRRCSERLNGWLDVEMKYFDIRWWYLHNVSLFCLFYLEDVLEHITPFLHSQQDSWLKVGAWMLLQWLFKWFWNVLVVSVNTGVLDECLSAPNTVDIEYQGENLFPERDLGRRANCWEVQVPNLSLQQWRKTPVSKEIKDGIKTAGFCQAWDWSWNITFFESHALTIASAWPGQCVYFQTKDRTLEGWQPRVSEF